MPVSRPDAEQLAGVAGSAAHAAEVVCLTCTLWTHPADTGSPPIDLLRGLCQTQIVLIAT